MVRSRSARQYTPGELRELYDRDWGPFAQPERNDKTLELGMTLEGVTSIADMSCGGADITSRLGAHFGVAPLLGDFGNVYGYQYTGTIQETVPQLGDVDLFVCSETLEHLEDPDADLLLIRAHCKRLLLTTPIWEEPEEPSHGHLWTWRQADVEEMLEAAGFTVDRFVAYSLWGMWTCR